MDRRSFLSVGAASALALPAAAGAATAVRAVEKKPQPQRFALGYHSGLDDGVWMNALDRIDEPGPLLLNIHLVGVQRAPGNHALRAMNVELLYRVKGVNQALAPYRFAHLKRDGDPSPVAKALKLTLEADQLAGLRVGYWWAESAGSVVGAEADLRWTSPAVPLLATGFYALLGPRQADGLPPRWSDLAAPGDSDYAVGRRDGKVPDFDAVLIAVESAE